MRSESLRSTKSTKKSKTDCDRFMARCVFKHPTTPQKMSPMRPLPHRPRCPIRISIVGIAWMICACTAHSQQVGHSQQFKDKAPANYMPKLEDITASTGIHF